MPRRKKLKVLGWSISIGALSIILLVIWAKAFAEITGSWFRDNASIIFIITSILVIIFLLLGWISIRNITKKGKNSFF